MRLHLCTTCRRTDLRRVECVPVRELVKVAKGWAAQTGQELEIEEVNCLSGCAVGLTAMIEDDDASVRLYNVKDGAVLTQVLDASEALLRGQPAGDVQPLVLSRTDWTEWRD
jgi:predicted metal-binding protein